MKPPDLSRRQLAAVLAVVLFVAAGSAAAYTTIFTAGSGTTYETGSGLVVSTSVNHGLDDANPFNDSDTVYINNLSVSASGQAAVTIDQFEGSTTDLSGIDAASTTVTVNPGDKPRVDISGDVTGLSYSAASLDDDEVAFTHSASGSGTVTMTGLAGSEDWTAATSSGDLVDSGTTSSSGEASISVDSASGEDVILFTNHQPSASNLSPADGAELTQPTVNFSVDVSDPEFSTSQGDSVEATLFVNGKSVGATTTTSNGTVSVTHDVVEGGTHEYYWELADSYGATTTTQTRTLNTPSELRIYNVSSAVSVDSPPELVNNVSIEVRMYQNETVYSRTTSDGTVNLTGISPAEPFVVVAETPGYFTRRIFVENLYDQQDLYLLPDNGIDVVFRLQEYTGNYPQDETILQVQRAINGSWQTALGDYFGANAQFPATLEYNTRYRLRLLNIETERSRILGTFTPIASGSQNVVVAPRGGVTVNGINTVWEFLATESMPATQVPFNASLRTGDDITVASWNVTASYVKNGSAQTLYHANSTTESGMNVSTALNLSGKAGGEVHVVGSYTTESGVTRTYMRTYRVSEYFASDTGLIPSLTTFVELAPESNQDALTSFLAMMLTVLVTAGVMFNVPMSTEIGGVVAWLVLAAFAIIGWVGYEMVFVAGVGGASLMYLRRRI